MQPDVISVTPRQSHDHARPVGALFAGATDHPERRAAFGRAGPNAILLGIERHGRPAHVLAVAEGRTPADVVQLPRAR